jgi:FkbM family methyltransferase
MQCKTIDIEGRSITIHGIPGDPYFESIEHYRGANEFLIQSISTLPANATIIDVGANIGLTASLFKSLIPACRVVCFEPDPVAHANLLRTLNGHSNIYVHREALGAVNGQISFTQNPHSASASHLSPDTSMADGAATVNVVRLDEFAKTEIKRIDFIKIDVEGFEPDVLEGGRQTISDYRPPVFLEFNSFTLIAFRNMNPRTFLESLFDIFPHVYGFTNGAKWEIRTRNDRLGFLHDNLVKHGCVDDLLCSFGDH